MTGRQRLLGAATVVAVLGGLTTSAWAADEGSIGLRIIATTTIANRMQAETSEQMSELLRIALRRYPWVRVTSDTAESRPEDAELLHEIWVSEVGEGSPMYRVRVRLTPGPGRGSPVIWDRLVSDSEFFGTAQTIGRLAAETLRRPVPEVAQQRLRVLPICFKQVQGPPAAAFLETALVHEVASALESGPAARDLIVRAPQTLATTCGGAAVDPAASAIDVIVTGSFEVVESRIRISVEVRPARQPDVVIASQHASGEPAAFSELARHAATSVSIELVQIAAAFRKTGSITRVVPRLTSRSLDELMAAAAAAVAAQRVDEAIGLYDQVVQRFPRVAEPRIALARLLRERGDLDGAAIHLTEAVQHNPDLVDAILELGQTLERLRRPAHAVALYQRAVQTATPPGLFRLLSALAGAYRAAGQEHRAIDTLEEWRRRDRNPPPELRRQLGIAYRNRQEFDKSLAELRPDAANRDELVQTYAAYARHLLATAPEIAARDLLREPEFQQAYDALPAEPLKAQLLLLKGLALVRAGDTLQALNESSAGLRAWQHTAAIPADIHFQISMLMARTALTNAAVPGVLEQARVAADTARRLNPESPEPDEVLGSVAARTADREPGSQSDHAREAATHFYAAARKYDKQRNYDDALRLFQQSLEQSPLAASAQPGWSWTKVVGLYAEACRLEDGRTTSRVLNWLDAARSTAEASVDVTFATALTYHYSGSPRDAVLAYEAARKLRDQDPAILINLGLTLEQMGELDRSREEFAKALKLRVSPYGRFLIAVGMGAIAAKKNDAATALIELRAAVDAQPNEPDAHVRLGDLHLASGEVSEAIARYETALRMLGTRSPTRCPTEPTILADLDVGLAKAYAADQRADAGIGHLKGALRYYEPGTRGRARVEQELRRLETSAGLSTTK
jgi:tetratricopeptide (TPR) repeat protein